MQTGDDDDEFYSVSIPTHISHTSKPNYRLHYQNQRRNQKYKISFRVISVLIMGVIILGVIWKTFFISQKSDNEQNSQENTIQNQIQEEGNFNQHNFQNQQLSLSPRQWINVPLPIIQINPTKEKIKYQLQKMGIDTSQQSQYNEENNQSQVSPYIGQNFSAISQLKANYHILHSEIIQVDLIVAKHRKLTSYSQQCHEFQEQNLDKKNRPFFMKINSWVRSVYQQYIVQGKNCYHQKYKGADLVLKGERNYQTWKSMGKHFTVVSQNKDIRIDMIQLWIPDSPGQFVNKTIFLLGISAIDTILTNQKTLSTQFIDKITIQHPGYNWFICQKNECFWKYKMVMFIMQPKMQLTGIKIYEIDSIKDNHHP